MHGEMIGVVDLKMTRTGASHNDQTNMKLEVYLADRQVPLSKREEMMAIGLVMVLHNEDPDMAYYVTQKLKLDPEKYQAMLGLMGCTKEELAKDDAESPKRKYKAAIQKGLDEVDKNLCDEAPFRQQHSGPAPQGLDPTGVDVDDIL